ncbi:MAG: DUF3472 domain-containing protein [Verrucomicrobiaceae bacterium]|nr:MAG: DUF3472 domain-containing protein [Verrucomicrobiaceae bacterium]
MHFPTTRRLLLVLVTFPASIIHHADARDWEIPLGGNAFVTEGDTDGARISRTGLSGWRNESTVVSVFFRTSGPAKLEVALQGSVPDGASVIRAGINGRHLECKATGSNPQSIKLGNFETPVAGYVRLSLQGVSKSGGTFADAPALVVSSDQPGLELAYVKAVPNDGGHFHFGRRGPSVHLQYPLPDDADIAYFYNEVTVPEGEDKLGSYFMANGFGEGYFGMQVNGPSERRILFSVWSPFKTDDPKQIPDSERVHVLQKGEGVSANDFGNEGSGGQSFLRYPWRTGVTYRFLNTVKPAADGSSLYTAWFSSPEEKNWRMIATFKRPKTQKHVTGTHSFLENFSEAAGWQSRRALYGNQWAIDTKGGWHELTEAVFTGDAMASAGERLDFDGGSQGEQFSLRNGGFSEGKTALRTPLQRKPSAAGAPKLDFPSLPGIKIAMPAE